MLKTISCAAAVLALGATASQAQTVTALVDGKSLVTIDAAKKSITRSVALDGGASLVGIDVRPADGKLYGLVADGTVVTVDPASGKWEKKSTLSEKLPSGVTFTVDFNPVADRLRVIASDGTNLRINVDDGKTTVDGKLKFAETDMHKGETPKVVAGAYSNSFAGTKETALYDIDGVIGGLLKQAPPNDGILNAIGKLGIKVDGPVAFDIAADGKGGNTGWLMAGKALYSIDLTTGKATSAGEIAGLKGQVGDMAVMPSKTGSM